MNAFKSLTVGTHFKGGKNKGIIDLFSGKASESELGDIFSKNPSSIATGKKDEKSVKDKKKIELETPTQEFEKEDEINAFRNRLKIKVKGEGIPPPSATFQQMNIGKDMKSLLLQNIENSFWKEPTPIQMQAIPVLLQNRDILACAPTGSGKTAAYLIPVLSKLRHHQKNVGIRGLLLAPTKELADQINRELLRLSEGKGFRVCELKKNILSKAVNDTGKSTFMKYDILIATPLRLVTLIRANAIDLSRVEVIIMDEADKLLELDITKVPKNDDEEESQEEEVDEEGIKRDRSSFLNQVDEILAQCPRTGILRGLFSATIGAFVRELATAFLQNPIEVSIGIENAGASTINQKLVFVGREDGKLLAIRQLVQEGLKPPVLLFVQSIDRAKELFRELVYDGINVDIMHSSRSDYQREEIMRRFRIGEIWILICTDLMARGIDFQGVQMVINYDLPLTPVNYIHRIGRTGRAGRRGEAVTFFTEQDLPRIRPIANVVKLSGCPVPDWMLSIKQLSTKNKRKLRLHAPQRRRISASTTPHGFHDEEEDQQEEDGEGNQQEKKNTKRGKKRRQSDNNDNDNDDHNNNKKKKQKKEDFPRKKKSQQKRKQQSNNEDDDN